MTGKILILAYYSFRDPVFQSAVLPYFSDFPSEKESFILLTFEHAKFRISDGDHEKIRSELAKQKIEWHTLQWRSGRFKPAKKIIDLVTTIYHGIKLIRSRRVKAVYSEGFPGAILGYYLCLITRRKHLIHSFEPHTDYMIESGVWKKNDWEAALLRFHEKWVAQHASHIFTATSLMVERLKSIGVRETSLHVVPSCVDEQHFIFREKERDLVRTELGISHDQITIVYIGKLGGMYMAEEAFEFFKLCQELLNAWILIGSTEPRDKIISLAENSGCDLKSITVQPLSRSEVPCFLSAADLGFVGVRPFPSKRFCSPIKTGEYLACGLPVIVPAGVSDDFDVLAQIGVGFVIKSLEKRSYAAVINTLNSRINSSNQSEIRRIAREYAIQTRSVKKYQRLYEKVFKSL